MPLKVKLNREGETSANETGAHGFHKYTIQLAIRAHFP